MSKRGATTQLTHDNWDHEEEPEEAGIFKKATDDVLKERKIKTAKRRGVSFQSQSESGSGAFKGFKGFGGFGAKPAEGPVSSGFKPLNPLSTSVSNGTTTAPASSTSLLSGGFKLDSSKTEPTVKLDSNKPDSGFKMESDKTVPAFKFDAKKSNALETKKTDSSSNNSKYLSQLRGLNECVTAWIKQHVDCNPYCILTPIFKDYEKYLADIEKMNKDVKGSTDTKERPEIGKSEPEPSVTSSGGFTFKPSSSTSTTSDSAPVFKFAVTTEKDTKDSSASSAITTSKTSDSSVTSSGAFSFKPTSSSSDVASGFKLSTTSERDTKDSLASSTTKTEADNGTKGFTFGSSGTTTTSGLSGFSFGSSSLGSTGGLAPFSFATGSTSGASSSNNGRAAGDEEEYQPPKPEVAEVKEDEAVYTKRCKIFYQKETKDGSKEWTEKGIGNLHLKVLDGGKVQLLIRADTNLGNILLNILLNKSIPLSRQGKNNVSMMCIPSPPLDPKMEENKPVMMLLRVKTSDDADELKNKMAELISASEGS